MVILILWETYRNIFFINKKLYYWLYILYWKTSGNIVKEFLLRLFHFRKERNLMFYDCVKRACQTRGQRFTICPLSFYLLPGKTFIIILVFYSAVRTRMLRIHYEKTHLHQMWLKDKKNQNVMYISVAFWAFFIQNASAIFHYCYLPYVICSFIWFIRNNCPQVESIHC